MVATFKILFHLIILVSVSDLYKTAEFLNSFDVRKAVKNGSF